MKTKKRKSKFFKYKVQSFMLFGFILSGALLSYRAMGLNAPAPIAGVSSWTNNAAANNGQTDKNLNVIKAPKVTTNKNTTQTNTPVAVPPKATTQPPGGSSSSPAKAAPAAPQPMANDIAPGSTCPGESDVAAAQTVLVCMTSYARNVHGISSVAANSKLMSAATAKAQDIINCGFSHTACGRSFDYWFGVEGYTGGCRGENIAEGQSTPLEVFTAWMNSAGHRANILSALYKDIGTAAANSSQGIVWVMELGGC